jgi:hypothetical protein
MAAQMLSQISAIDRTESERLQTQSCVAVIIQSDVNPDDQIMMEAAVLSTRIFCTTNASCPRLWTMAFHFQVSMFWIL